MNQPFFSIIIPVYNGAATLEQCLQSVLQQDFAQKEIIIIDGNSNDGTKRICEQYRNQINIFLSEPDNGIYDAMNKGIRRSTGKYIYFLGADDVLVNKNVLSDVYNSEIQDADFVYGTIILKSDKRKVGSEKTYTQVIAENISHQAIFFKKDLFARVGLYDLRYKILSDYELNLRIFKTPTIITRFIPISICVFNDKGGVSNTVIDTPFFKNMLDRFTHEESIPFKSPLLQKYNFFYGVSLFFKGNRSLGWKYIMRSLLNGERKFYYQMVFVKMFLSFNTFLFRKPRIL